VACWEASTSKEEFALGEYISIAKLRKFRPTIGEFCANSIFSLAGSDADFEWTGVRPAWSSQGINNELFNQSLITCQGIITGGGFETPAEALYLGKKLMVVPINGQYEQQCNAAALSKDFNVPVIYEMDDYFPLYFNKWIFDSQSSKLELIENTKDIIANIFNSAVLKKIHSINSIQQEIPATFLQNELQHYNY